MKTETLLPLTITLPGGRVMVRDAFDPAHHPVLTDYDKECLENLKKQYAEVKSPEPIVNKETLLPKTLTFPSGMTMVQDAFEPHRWHGISDRGFKNWTEFFQDMVDNGKVGK
jgi:hypothetical protein